MGEAYGSTWTAMLYFLMIGIFFMFLIMGMEIVSFWGGIHKINDGLKEGDLTVFNALPSNFRVCSDDEGEPITHDTYTSCTGVVADSSPTMDMNDVLDDAMRTGKIPYQVEYHGMYIEVPANTSGDFKANLSY